jgi:hypothetical protein
MRTVIDAILYIASTGCQWRQLPKAREAGDTDVAASAAEAAAIVKIAKARMRIRISLED